MTNELREKMIRVARMAQRNAKGSDEHAEATALLDDLKEQPAETAVVDMGSLKAEANVTTVPVEKVGPIAPDSKFFPGQDVAVQTEPEVTKPADKAKGGRK